jgi:PHP family Zn ribbon phosphoesterase
MSSFDMVTQCTKCGHRLSLDEIRDLAGSNECPKCGGALKKGKPTAEEELKYRFTKPDSGQQ